MLPSFSWKGYDSWYDLGLIINELPSIPKPQKKVKTIEIEGRDGELVIDTESYKPISFPLKCTLLDNTRMDELKGWLEGYDKLIFNWLDDRYYKARMVDGYDIEQTLDNEGEFTIVFESEPFAYDYNSQFYPIEISQPTEIINCFTYYSEPIIKVYATGNVTLYVGDNQQISLTNVIDYVTIDSVLQECYKDSLLMNRSMNGEFPKLFCGSNLIRWTGAVSKVEIIPNFRGL